MTSAAAIPGSRFFRLFPLILISVLLILFAIGILQLFLLRFNIGDIYPPYSSFRSDPIGAKAFYESLTRLSDIRVSRNVKPLRSSFDSKDTTYFILGASAVMAEFLSKDAIQSFNDLVLTGGRLVISFFPIQELPLEIGQKSYSRKISTDILTTQWGVSFASEKTSPDVKPPYAALKNSQLRLPDAVPWRSSLYFDQLHPSWNCIYTLNTKPVMIERTFGKGTIVLLSDSYLFSNEALSKERHPKILTWLLQDNPSVIFDEYHFGIRHEPGLMNLIRKFKFHGIMIGLLITSALFIWKNAFPLIPPKDTVLPEWSENVGKDHAEGMICLLRRYVPEKDVFLTCVNEWKNTIGKNTRRYPESIHQMMNDVAIQDSGSDPVKTYQQIARLLRSYSFVKFNNNGD